MNCGGATLQKSEDIGVGASKNDSGAPSPSFPPRLLTFKIPHSHTPIWSDIIPKNGQINNSSSSEVAVGHVNKKMKTENSIAAIREAYRNTKDPNPNMATLRIEPKTQFRNLRLYSVKYTGSTYGIIAIACNGRVIVKGGHRNSAFGGVSTDNIMYPRIGSIIVAVNGYVLP
jgi:hypothetical protein